MSLLISGDLRLAKGQPVPNDPNFAFNSLLLHGDGTNGSTVITDSSGSPKTVTAVGNAQISTAIADPFGNSTGVIAFDGTGDYLSINGSTGLLNFSSEDFTVEAWVYANSIAGRNIIGNYSGTVANSSYVLQMVSNGNIESVIYVGNGAVTRAQASISVNAWTHIASVRNSNTLVTYVNGISTATASISPGASINTSSAEIKIGTEAAGFFWNGYIDDLRITKGVARYTANFTPPTAPFPDF
jgi:hypothetical protein